MYKYALLLMLAMSASSWPTITAGARSRPARGRYTSAVPSARTGYGNYAPSYGTYPPSYESHAPGYGGHAADYANHAASNGAYATDYGSHTAGYGGHAHRYGDYAHRYGDYAHRYGSYAYPGFTDPNYAYPYSARYAQPAYVG